MTGNTGTWQPDFSCYFLNVTGQTINILMRTIQFVIRVNGVFKLPQRPVIRVMTQLTALAQAAFMHIIRLMTDIAFTGRHFVRRRQVTFFARRYSMQTEQWKIGHIVLETHLPAPTIFVMAFLTALTFLSPVNIICSMTTETLHCKLFLVNFTFMAG